MCKVPTCARIQSCSTSLLTIQQRICSRNLSNYYLLCYPVLFHTRAGQRQCGPRGTSDTLRAWLVGTICTRTIIANRTKYSFRTIMFQWNTATEVTLLLAFGLLQMQILDDTPWLPLAESVDEDHAQCTSGCNSDDIEISPDASTPWTRKYCKSSACTHRRFSQPRTEERERTSIYLLPGRDRFATQLNQHTKHKFAKCTPDSPVNNSVHQDHLVKNKLHTRITSSRHFIGGEKWRLAIIFLLIFTHLPCGSLSPVSNYIPMMNVEDSAPTEPDSDDYHTAAQHLKDISEFRPPSEELPCRYRFREDVETSALLADYVVVGWPVKAYTEPYNPLYNVSLFVTAVLKSQPQTVFPIREQHLVRVGQFSKIPDPGRCWIDVQKDTMYIFFIKQPNWAGFCEISQLPVAFSLDALSKIQNILKLGSYPLQMRPLHHADRLQVDEGNDVLLSCRVRGRPTPLISWFFNRIEIKTPWKPGSERGIVQASRYLSKLQLGKVRPSDSGNYTCLAENLNGHIRKSVQIIDSGSNFVLPTGVYKPDVRLYNGILVGHDPGPIRFGRSLSITHNESEPKFVPDCAHHQLNYLISNRGD
ncbi:unnamed protein product [Calicophoron daubneyi]|uniref:Ig-like domain-containing protein n=1 Tax=Calicophoron daubneyi TaxID=300641 RepID=A0AAV2TVM4_CALDB